MVNTYEIKSFENLVTIGATLGKNWYRGHAKIYEDLTPGIFREKYNSPLHEMFKPQQELEVMINFKRYAPTIIEKNKLPDEFDFLTWLYWIQHFGIPTRLLDWTENIFVATFFCVIHNQKEDGEIWTMYPDNLNRKSGFYGLALQNHHMVKYLSSEAFHTNPDELLKDMGLKNFPKYPIALNPPKIFPRMTAQHSVFTIHSKISKTDVDCKKFIIQNCFSNENDITRYIIPAKLKSDFEKKLSYIGFNYRTLFPDLEGLAKSFARDDRYFGWGQPMPPKF